MIRTDENRDEELREDGERGGEGREEEGRRQRKKGETFVDVSNRSRFARRFLPSKGAVQAP